MAFELLGIASMKVTRVMIGFFSPEAVSIDAGVGPAGMWPWISHLEECLKTDSSAGGPQMTMNYNQNEYPAPKFICAVPYVQANKQNGRK